MFVEEKKKWKEKYCFNCRLYDLHLSFNKKKCTWHNEPMNFHKSYPKNQPSIFPVKFKSLFKQVRYSNYLR